MQVKMQTCLRYLDSKLLQLLSNQNVSEERLPVAVGTTDQIKLLGVPSYKPGTDRKSGDIIAGLTMNLLEPWHCTNSIVNMVSDTTASNTGHLTAACIKIQDGLQQALLWSGYRHHEVSLVGHREVVENIDRWIRHGEESNHPDRINQYK